MNNLRGLAALNELFHRGRAPDPLPDGRYPGEMLSIDVAPGLTSLAEAVAAAWMPWKGKDFDRARAVGCNLFTRDFILLAHLIWPLYRGYTKGDGGYYRAFAFRTYLGPGLADPDLRVLKIDYDIPENPAFLVRRVLDELVQLSEGLYLGKSHFHWWWGRWQTIAFFALRQSGHAG